MCYTDHRDEYLPTWTKGKELSVSIRTYRMEEGDQLSPFSSVKEGYLGIQLPGSKEEESEENTSLDLIEHLLWFKNYRKRRGILRNWLTGFCPQEYISTQEFQTSSGVWNICSPILQSTLLQLSVHCHPHILWTMFLPLFSSVCDPNYRLQQGNVVQLSDRMNLHCFQSILIPWRKRELRLWLLHFDQDANPTICLAHLWTGNRPCLHQHKWTCVWTPCDWAHLRSHRHFYIGQMDCT